MMYGNKHTSCEKNVTDIAQKSVTETIDDMLQVDGTKKKLRL